VSNVIHLYDQAQDVTAIEEAAAVVERARESFAFGIRSIRRNDNRATDGLLDAMQVTFDNLASLSSRLIECIVPTDPRDFT
jgi:hypothetical protein